MNKKQIIGIVIFVVLIGIVIGIKALSNIGIGFNSNLTTVYVATGGGKEDFISDPGKTNEPVESYQPGGQLRRH